MAAAVSNAGGLGTISALTQGTAENLRAEIQKCTCSSLLCGFFPV